jgi:hypothetical protein
MRGLRIFGETSDENVGQVKIADAAGGAARGTCVEVPDEGPIADVKEGDADAVPFSCGGLDSRSVTLGLFKDVLWIYGDLLRFEDAEELAADEQTVMGPAHWRSGVLRW